MTVKCDCIKKVDQELEKQGLTLEKSLSLSRPGGKMTMALVLPTKRLNSRSRAKKNPLLPSFCPFCGENQMPGEIIRENHHE